MDIGYYSLLIRFVGETGRPLTFKSQEEGKLVNIIERLRKGKNLSITSEMGKKKETDYVFKKHIISMSLLQNNNCELNDFTVTSIKDF